MATKVGRPAHEYEAWVAGEHRIPDGFPVGAGEVLVHDKTVGWWRVLSRTAFSRQFEWV